MPLQIKKLVSIFLIRLEGFLAMLEEDADHEKRRIDVYSIFDPKMYIKFRDQTILRSAIEFAREGRIGAVSSLLARYPAELNKVRFLYK